MVRSKYCQMSSRLVTADKKVGMIQIFNLDHYWSIIQSLISSSSGWSLFGIVLVPARARHPITWHDTTREVKRGSQVYYGNITTSGTSLRLLLLELLWSTMIGRPCHVTLAFSVIQYQAPKSPQLPVHHHCLCWSRLKWWGFGVNQATDHSLVESGGLLCLPFGSNESEFVWRTWTNQQPRGQQGLRLRHKCGSCWCTSGSCWHNLPQFYNTHHRL